MVLASAGHAAYIQRRVPYNRSYRNPSPAHCFVTTQVKLRLARIQRPGYCSGVFARWELPRQLQNPRIPRNTEADGGSYPTLSTALSAIVKVRFRTA